jgi:hypothetical protein
MRKKLDACEKVLAAQNHLASVTVGDSSQPETPKSGGRKQSLLRCFLPLP